MLLNIKWMNNFLFIQQHAIDSLNVKWTSIQPGYALQIMAKHNI